MNKYESVIVIKPKLEEEEIENIIQKVKEIVEQDGTLTQVDKKGIKNLAYEINKCKEGYFIYFHYETDPSLIADIERYFRINENILKFLTIKKED